MIELTIDEVQEAKARIRAIEQQLTVEDDWHERKQLLLERDELIEALGPITESRRRRR